jgi:hypothetical protein
MLANQVDSARRGKNARLLPESLFVQITGNGYIKHRNSLRRREAQIITIS